MSYLKPKTAVMIFSNFLISYWIFRSLQAKRKVVISNKKVIKIFHMYDRLMLSFPR